MSTAEPAPLTTLQCVSSEELAAIAIWRDDLVVRLRAGALPAPT
jgi:hypothetical protein